MSSPTIIEIPWWNVRNLIRYTCEVAWQASIRSGLANRAYFGERAEEIARIQNAISDFAYYYNKTYRPRDLRKMRTLFEEFRGVIAQIEMPDVARFLSGGLNALWHAADALLGYFTRPRESISRIRMSCATAITCAGWAVPHDVLIESEAKYRFIDVTRGRQRIDDDNPLWLAFQAAWMIGDYAAAMQMARTPPRRLEFGFVG